MRRTLLRTLRVLTVEPGYPLRATRATHALHPATRNLLIPTLDGTEGTSPKKFAEQLPILRWNLLHREASYLNMRPRCELWYRS
jgi:hypothetical protein